MKSFHYIKPIMPDREHCSSQTLQDRSNMQAMSSKYSSRQYDVSTGWQTERGKKKVKPKDLQQFLHKQKELEALRQMKLNLKIEESYDKERS